MKMTIVLLLALGVVGLLRHRSAALRHWVLATALACAAVMPILELVVPAWSMPLSAPAAIQSRSSEVRAPALASARTDGAIEQQTEFRIADSNTSGMFRTIWLGGVAAGLGFLLVGLARLTWLASSARRITEGPWHDLAQDIAREYRLHRTFLLLQSDHPSLLVTWGLALPKIILPATADRWTQERARVVLSHELAHICRGDWIVQLAAELLRSIYWFNPLLWIFCRRLRLESEHACDDEVMNRGMPGADYATHLVELARSLNQTRHTWFPAPAMARPSSLERRVRAMLNQRLNRNPIGGSTRAIVLVTLIVMSAAIAAAQSTFQTFSGTVVDATGKPVPGVTLVVADARRQAKYEVKTNDAGAFEVIGLPSGNYVVELQANAAGFRPLKETVTLNGSNVQRRLVLQIGSLEETITVGIGAGPATAPVVKEVSPKLNGCVATAVGGDIRAPRKIRDVYPQYPEQLRGTDTEGTVVMNATIGVDGYVTDVQVVGSPQADLANAAVAAVRDWRYSQTLLNCMPVEVQMRVTITFKPMPGPQPAAPKP
jgi:TonB family protein